MLFILLNPFLHAVRGLFFIINKNYALQLTIPYPYPTLSTLLRLPYRPYVTLSLPYVTYPFFILPLPLSIFPLFMQIFRTL